MIDPRSLFTVAAASLVLAACGGSATAAERIDGCLKKQPDATEAECKQWEKDGELADDGTHEGHDAG